MSPNKDTHTRKLMLLVISGAIDGGLRNHFDVPHTWHVAARTPQAVTGPHVYICCSTYVFFSEHLIRQFVLEFIFERYLIFSFHHSAHRSSGPPCAGSNHMHHHKLHAYPSIAVSIAPPSGIYGGSVWPSDLGDSISKRSTAGARNMLPFSSHICPLQRVPVVFE